MDDLPLEDNSTSTLSPESGGGRTERMALYDERFKLIAIPMPDGIPLLGAGIVRDRLVEDTWVAVGDDRGTRIDCFRLRVDRPRESCRFLRKSRDKNRRSATYRQNACCG